MEKVAEILFANQSISQRSTDQWEDRSGHPEEMGPPTNAYAKVWFELVYIDITSILHKLYDPELDTAILQSAVL